MGTESLADPPATAALAVSAQVSVERWTAGCVARTTDLVAEEVPVALVYHDVPHVVMLATPADLEDYGVGFTLSEGLVERTEEIRGIEVAYGDGVADVRITVAWERFTQLLQRRRNLAGPHRMRPVRGGDRRGCDPRSRPRTGRRHAQRRAAACGHRAARGAPADQRAHRQRARGGMGAAARGHPAGARGRRPPQRARQGHRGAGARRTRTSAPATC